MTTRVADILRHKGGRIVTIEPTATVYDAIAKMVEHNVGSILVTEDEALCGIFTERDYLRRIILQGRTSTSGEGAKPSASRRAKIWWSMSLRGNSEFETSGRGSRTGWTKDQWNS